MVLYVPLAGEAVAGRGAVAIVVGAKERLVTMSVYGVGLTLVPGKV